LRSRTSLAAENLFLRKQLAFYQERKVKPKRADNPTRLTLALLSRWFDWRDRRLFSTWPTRNPRAVLRPRQERSIAIDSRSG
jgi:hypothetical protein